jgi:hypothetical protein
VSGEKLLTRTYRNRSTVPHGYEVRDGGQVFYKEGFRTHAARASVRSRLSREAKEMGIPWYYRYQIFRRVDDPDPPPFRSRWMRKEKKPYRKDDFRRYRAKIRNLMRNERYDDIWNYTRTGGWLTW